MGIPEIIGIETRLSAANSEEWFPVMIILNPIRQAILDEVRAFLYGPFCHGPTTCTNDADYVDVNGQRWL